MTVETVCTPSLRGFKGVEVPLFALRTVKKNEYFCSGDGKA